jgi:hypothetical protein
MRRDGPKAEIEALLANPTEPTEGNKLLVINRLTHKRDAAEWQRPQALLASMQHNQLTPTGQAGQAKELATAGTDSPSAEH